MWNLNKLPVVAFANRNTLLPLVGVTNHQRRDIILNAIVDNDTTGLMHGVINAPVPFLSQ